MTNILEVIDKTKRVIYLTDERYKHILKHPEMQNKLEFIRKTLENPLKIMDFEENVKFYYTYHKNIKSKAKYLRVIVKYLNGNGFIVTAYFVDKLR